MTQQTADDAAREHFGCVLPCGTRGCQCRDVAALILERERMALEAAAKACDDESLVCEREITSSGKSMAILTAEVCAERIRALARKVLA